MRTLQSTTNLTRERETQGSFDSRVLIGFREKVNGATGAVYLARHSTCLAGLSMYCEGRATKISSIAAVAYGVARTASLCAVAGVLAICTTLWGMGRLISDSVAGALSVSVEFPFVDVCFSLRSFPPRVPKAGRELFPMVSGKTDEVTRAAQADETKEKRNSIVVNAGNSCTRTARGIAVSLFNSKRGRSLCYGITGNC